MAQHKKQLATFIRQAFAPKNKVAMPRTAMECSMQKAPACDAWRGFLVMVRWGVLNARPPPCTDYLRRRLIRKASRAKITIAATAMPQRAMVTRLEPADAGSRSCATCCSVTLPSGLP